MCVMRFFILNPFLMDNTPHPSSTQAGTAGGTLLCLLLQIQTSEILKTMLLAATGAAVSYLVSFALRQLLKKCRSK